VKKEIFFQILECMDVDLSLKEKQWISKWYEKNGKVDWQEPIKFLIMGLKTPKWSLRKDNKPGVKSHTLDKQNLETLNRSQNGDPLDREVASIAGRNKRATSSYGSSVKSRLTSIKLKDKGGPKEVMTIADMFKKKQTHSAKSSPRSIATHMSRH
jgi:hypothetical protein